MTSARAMFAQDSLVSARQIFFIVASTGTLEI